MSRLTQVGCSGQSWRTRVWSPAGVAAADGSSSAAPRPRTWGPACCVLPTGSAGCGSTSPPRPERGCAAERRQAGRRNGRRAGRQMPGAWGGRPAAAVGTWTASGPTVDPGRVWAPA